MKKVLVTGGAGFVGTNLVKRLLDEGHEVVVVDNFTTGKITNKQEGVIYLEEDIKNRLNYSVIQPYLYFDYDVVFHLAAIARIQPSFENPKDYFETNANGTFYLAEYCSKNNIPMIYAGSSSHHSGKFKNPYTFSKDIGEEVLKLFETHFNLKYANTRFYNVYGPYQLEKGGYTTLIGRWINNIKNQLPCEIYGDGEQKRDFTHVDDIIDALMLIMEKEAYGNTFELGRGKNYSINEVAKMFNITPNYKDPKPGEARNTLCDSNKAKEILNWNPQKNLVDYIKKLKIKSHDYIRTH